MLKISCAKIQDENKLRKIKERKGGGLIVCENQEKTCNNQYNCNIFVLLIAYIFGYVSYKSDTFGNIYINGISIKNTTVSSASSKIKKV